MVRVRVAPPSKPCDRPQETGCGYKASHVLLVLFVVFLGAVAAASAVVGAVLLYRCIRILLLDLWLIVNGVSALGALAGVMVWSNKMATGRFLNGPKILAFLLISLHFIWLVIGNIFVVAAYVTCEEETFMGTISCSSGYLHFSLVVIIIFDLAYVVLFVFLCKACSGGSSVQGWTHPALGESGCCARPACLTSLYGIHDKLSWQEWVIILVLAGYTLLALTSVALGSSFLGICSDVWEPYWLIVHGVVTIVTFCAALCCLCYPEWIEISWSRNNFVVFLPVLILGLLELMWIIHGNSLAMKFRVLSCPEDDVCNKGLHVFTLVMLFLLDLPFLALIYIGTIFFILIIILLLISCCYDCCRKVEEDTCEKDTSNNSCSSDSSDSD